MYSVCSCDASSMVTAWRAPGGIHTARDGGTMAVVSQAGISPVSPGGADTVTCSSPLAQ
ncbi:hypothetical protein D9M70_603690 [compost metagenome]